MFNEIILYDLPSQPPCRSWSGNVWKTRLALNFKGVPYKTEWVSYSRLQEALKSLGLEPNPPGSWSEYSVPTVRFPDGSLVMDSAAIATDLESRYPSPSLRLNPEVEKEAQAAMGQVFTALIPYLFPLAPDIVASDDIDWFKTDRAARFGMTVDEAFHTEKDPAPFFEAAKPGFEKCATVLSSHKVDDGPFVLGSAPSYADFYLTASLQMFHQMNKNASAEVMSHAGPDLNELFQACQKWTSKDD